MKTYADRQLDYIESCCPIDCRPILKKEVRGKYFVAQIHVKNIPVSSTKLLLDYYIWGEEPDNAHEVICEIERRGIKSEDIEREIKKAIKKLCKLEG